MSPAAVLRQENFKQNIVILRIWHAFDARKLNNIGGIKGNDLLPLPNTKEFPYVDILINDSKIAPEIFIYSGKNLSQSQRKQYEDLHQKAKEAGGQLFVLDGDECVRPNAEDIMQSAMEKEIIFTGPDYKYCGLYCREIQQILYLNCLSKVQSLVKEKYGIKEDFKGMLYSDFVCKSQKALEFLESNDVRHVMLPIRIFSSSEEFYKASTRHDFFVKKDFETVIRKYGKNFTSELVVDIGIKQIYKPNDGKLFSPHEKALEGSSLKRFKTKSEFADINNECERELKRRFRFNYVTVLVGSLIGICCPLEIHNDVMQTVEECVAQRQMPGYRECEDYTWEKDIPQLILDAHKEEKAAQGSGDAKTDKKESAPSQKVKNPSLEQLMKDNLRKAYGGGK